MQGEEPNTGSAEAGGDVFASNLVVHLLPILGQEVEPLSGSSVENFIFLFFTC